MTKPRPSRAKLTAVLFAVLVLIASSLPYAIGATRQNAEWRFSGFVLGVDDGHSYLGKMRLGARGEWNFRIFYTPEAHEPEALLYLPYIAAGWLIGGLVPHTDAAHTSALILGFHALRLICGALLMFTLWRFIGRFISQPRPRLTAYVLATLGGGFGWLLALTGNGDWLGSLPPEFYIPEGFGWLVLLTLPHVALARAALLGGLLLVMNTDVSFALSVGRERRSEAQRVRFNAETQPHLKLLSLGAEDGTLFTVHAASYPAHSVSFPLPRKRGEGKRVRPVFRSSAGDPPGRPYETPLKFSPSPRLHGRRGRGMRGFVKTVLPSTQREGLPRLVLAALLWNIVGLCVPFYLAVIYAVLAAWIGVAWLRDRVFPATLIKRLALAGGLTLPLFAYYSLAFAGNPAFGLWSGQNLLPSPHPLQYAVAYGGLILLALVGGLIAWRRGADHGADFRLLIGWLLIVPVLVYLPINVQRRTAEAVIVPLAILAALGLERFRKSAIHLVAIVVFSLSALFMLSGSLLTALNPQPPVYIAGITARALEWLNVNAEPDAVILSLIETGTPIPAYTTLRTYVGHGPETLDYNAKAERAEAFFAGLLSESERADLLDGACLPDIPSLCADRVRYVLVTPAERALIPADADPLAGMTLLYEADDVAIYGR